MKPIFWFVIIGGLVCRTLTHFPLFVKLLTNNGGSYFGLLSLEACCV